jgi:hypothetical protein
MNRTRFFNFPLGYLGVEKGLPELSYAQDEWSIRLDLLTRDSIDNKNAYSHMSALYIYEVLQLPDRKAVGDPINVRDWQYYNEGGLRHSRKCFSSLLETLVLEFESVKFCSGAMCLSEYNWFNGKPADWKRFTIEDLTTGIFKDFPWGDDMDEIGNDLIFYREGE